MSREGLLPCLGSVEQGRTAVISIDDHVIRCVKSSSDGWVLNTVTCIEHPQLHGALNHVSLLFLEECFARAQGRKELEQEGLMFLLARYAWTTEIAYNTTQRRWWQLFCYRRGEADIRHVPACDRVEEQLVLDFVVHFALNESRAPGTVKLRLAAARSMRLTLGKPDPLAHMPRAARTLAGLKRQYGTRERRRPQKRRRRGR